MFLLAFSGYGADIQMWVDDAAGVIGVVDVNTGGVNVVGATGLPLTDIAFAPNGTLYGITYSDLYTISTSNAEPTLIGPLSGVTGIANSLVFGQNGDLYMASNNLYTLNANTAAPTLIGSIGYQSGGDLAFLNRTLYLSTASDQLVAVNTKSGTGILVGNIGVPAMYGLATPGNEVLYGVAGTGLYFVNTSTGAASLDVDYSGHGLGIAGGESFLSEALPATTTPEPASGMLLASGFLVYAGFRYWRKLQPQS